LQGADWISNGNMVWNCIPRGSTPTMLQTLDLLFIVTHLVSTPQDLMGILTLYFTMIYAFSMLYSDLFLLKLMAFDN